MDCKTHITCCKTAFIIKIRCKVNEQFNTCNYYKYVNKV